MSDFIYNYEGMEAAAKKIEALAEEYSKASATFVKNFNASIAGWEGASKKKMAYFIENPVATYIGSNIPELLRGLATLLRTDITQMQNADEEVANSIPDQL